MMIQNGNSNERKKSMTNIKIILLLLILIQLSCNSEHKNEINNLPTPVVSSVEKHDTLITLYESGVNELIYADTISIKNIKTRIKYNLKIKYDLQSDTIRLKYNPTGSMELAQKCDNLIEEDLYLLMDYEDNLDFCKKLINNIDSNYVCGYVIRINDRDDPRSKIVVTKNKEFLCYDFQLQRLEIIY